MALLEFALTDSNYNERYFPHSSNYFVVEKELENVASDSIPHEIIRNDFKKYYDEYNLDGMFVLFDSRKKDYIFYNKALYNQSSTPASTFNILFTLIGLQEGIIRDENSTLNSEDSGYNKNLNLKTAFAQNYESYFRAMIKEISEERIKYWLAKINYGNKDVTNHPHDFWLGTSLQITPAQQLNFIENFYYENLPFLKQHVRKVKKMMLEKDSLSYKVFGKRGSYKIISENKYMGWFVGYVETSDDVYFFVNYVQSNNLNHPRLVDAQKEIPFKILRSLKLMY